LLNKLQWFLPDIFILKREGGGQTSADTIIIDECSMVSTDLLGTLFKAINLNMVKRLILVGDPNQLPPIGPGRPFVDIVAWLSYKHPDCIATLNTTMRISDEADVPIGKSVALAFADGFRSDSVDSADDEILSLIAQEKTLEDLEVHFWKDHDELKQLLQESLQSLIKIGGPGDYESFNLSLGISKQVHKQSNWRDAESTKDSSIRYGGIKPFNPVRVPDGFDPPGTT